MRRWLTATFVLTLLAGADGGAQGIDDALVPGGRLRVEMTPVFTSWDSRFGRAATGEESREALGQDLTTPSAELLFPGAESLRTAIQSMSGTPAYAPLLGETSGRVSKDVTRIEFGAHIGVFDWLTVGAVLPWTRTRTSVDIGFQPETPGDLGLNPGVSAAAVDAFLQALAGAEAGAQTNVTQVCGTSPGSPACESATALAARTAAFHGSAVTAYGASPFFPLAGSTTAASLAQATSALDADLVAQGLSGIGAPMAFATQGVDELGLATLPETGASGVLGAPLGDVRGLWHTGDVEVSVTARILEGEAVDPLGGSSRYSYRVVATVLGRLPTGQIDDADVFLDVGTGDGQPDIEGRLGGALTLGHRIGLLGAVRYGVQLPRTLVRRVAPPEQVLAPLSTRHIVEWDPGAYWGLEIAPALRLSDELSIGGEYRVFRKYRDNYELVGASAGAPVDPLVLEQESGVTLHEVGITLRYDTVTRWLADGTTRPLQFHGRLLRAVAGGGGQTPITTRVEFGVRLFRRLWGSS
jgi:hypothetical protein